MGLFILAALFSTRRVSGLEVEIWCWRPLTHCNPNVSDRWATSVWSSQPWFASSAASISPRRHCTRPLGAATTEPSPLRVRGRSGGFWNGGCVNWAEMEPHCRFRAPSSDYLMTNAIMQYLASKKPNNLWPHQQRIRADISRWQNWAATMLEPTIKRKGDESDDKAHDRDT